MSGSTSKEVDNRCSAVRWLARFEAALASRHIGDIQTCFAEDSYWRDLVAFTWDIGWIHGNAAIARALLSGADARGQVSFRLSANYPSPRDIVFLGRHLLEIFFDLETAQGRGNGIVRLLSDDSPLKIRAWCLLTTLESFRDTWMPRPGLRYRRASLGYDRTYTGKNWINHRQERQGYADRDPEVLIVGGGHAGLFPAVELSIFGVDCLVVDRHQRVGDNWRTRYHSLALHTPTDVSQFPYLNYPGTFPSYLPKDQLANWFEIYVNALEINYWTSTEFVGGSFDELERKWKVTLRRPDGSERVMRPSHLILATGITGGLPNIPSLQGLKRYRREVLHSSQFGSGADYANKRVLVLGTGTSGHDIAYDLHQHGAHVTMMQRGPTTIVELATAELPFVESFNGALSEEVDLLLYKMNYTFPLLQRSLQEYTALTKTLDRDLTERLEKVGFLLDDGEDQTGHIIATGYLKPTHQLGTFFSAEMVRRIGDIGGLDHQGEYRNMFKRTKQNGLWFSGGGGIFPCRAMSKYLAIQIKAAIDGVNPGYVPPLDH
jgi:hypothetical protein